MASLEVGTATAGDEVELDLRGRRGIAAVVDLPIYRGSVRSPTASKH